MNAKHYMGDDDRALAPDYELDDCQHCRALWNEKCEPTCECPHCVKTRERDAKMARDHTKDAA